MERTAEGPNRCYIELCRKFVFGILIANRGIRFSVPRIVERDDAKMLGDRGVAEQMPELPGIGSGGVETNEGNSLPCLFEIDPAIMVHDPDGHVSANNGLY